MNLFLFMIAPHDKRALVSTLADLIACANDEAEGLTPHQVEVMEFFDDADDIADAVELLSKGKPYMGYAAGDECPVGISAVSPDAAKLVALDQLLETMENDKQCSGPFTLSH